MIEANMLEAKTKLSQLVEAAERGEEVFLKRNGVPVAQIVNIRRLGFLSDFCEDKPEAYRTLFCSIAQRKISKISRGYEARPLSVAGHARRNLDGYGPRVLAALAAEGHPKRRNTARQLRQRLGNSD